MILETLHRVKFLHCESGLCLSSLTLVVKSESFWGFKNLMGTARFMYLLQHCWSAVYFFQHFTRSWVDQALSLCSYSAPQFYLVDFKKGLKDPSDRLSSWIDNVDCCQWEGVNCSKKSGHVIQLHLQNSAPIVDDLIDAEFFSEFEHGRDGGDPKSAFSGKINYSLRNLTHLH